MTEKSNLKMKYCPGVTLPSSICFCTSRPCRIKLESQLIFSTSQKRSREPERGIHVDACTAFHGSIPTYLLSTTFQTGEGDGSSTSSKTEIYRVRSNKPVL